MPEALARRPFVFDVLGYSGRAIGTGVTIRDYRELTDAYYDFARKQQHKQYFPLVVLNGGEDVSPAAYGEKVVYAHAYDRPSGRDVMETKIVETAIEMQLPLLGICRGAQLINVVAGGKLWQHVDGHGGTQHDVECPDGSHLDTNSFHHQMIRLDVLRKKRIEFELLGWSQSRSSRYFAENETQTSTEHPVDPEVVYFPEILALCVQGHPEWGSPIAPYTRRLLREKFGNWGIPEKKLESSKKAMPRNPAQFQPLDWRMQARGQAQAQAAQARAAGRVAGDELLNLEEQAQQIREAMQREFAGNPVPPRGNEDQAEAGLAGQQRLDNDF